MQEKSSISDLYEGIASDLMPQIVNMSADQKEYVEQVFASAEAVILNVNTIEQLEKSFLGAGEYHWPKDPSAPVKRVKFFPTENFKMPGIDLTFARPTQNSNWNRVELSVHPRNYPTGVYSMDLNSAFFSNYKLKTAEFKSAPNSATKHFNVYHFVNIKNPNLSLKVEARDDISSLQDSHPRSFHSLTFVKTE
jgi:hypothetical protein